MNVWAVQKDLTLKYFLLELVHRFGENTFCLKKDVEHFQAVEIYLAGRPELSAYVYTFSQAANHFGVDLYFPIVIHEIVGQNEELEIEELLSIIETHFDLTIS